MYDRDSQFTNNKEEAWDFKEAVDLAVVVRKKCIRPLAQAAKKIAKSRLSPAVIVRFIARNVSRSVKTPAASLLEKSPGSKGLSVHGATKRRFFVFRPES